MHEGVRQNHSGGNDSVGEQAEIAIQPESPAQPRAIGRVRLSARRRGARSVIAEWRHSGSAKALLPRGPGPELEAVLLNTAGGITGGDDFGYEADAEPGAALSLATQTAERAYRALPGLPGRLAVRLRAEAGAAIAWLPQETILFEGSALSRRLDVDLAEDARFIAVEPIIFGRTAMGEQPRSLRFSDQWRVRRAGRLIYADALRIAGDTAPLHASPAVLGPARAMASIVYAAADAETRLASLRPLLPQDAGASLVAPGLLVVRLRAEDGFALRRGLLPMIRALRDGALPKVWMI